VFSAAPHYGTADDGQHLIPSLWHVATPSSVRNRTLVFVPNLRGAHFLASRLAQQGGPRRRIGVLMTLPADDPDGQVRNAAFLQGRSGVLPALAYRIGGPPSEGGRMTKRSSCHISASSPFASCPACLTASGSSAHSVRHRTARGG
jgi:hypothetical protein